MNPNGHNPYPPGYPQANPSQPMGVPQGPPGGYPNAPYPGMGSPPRPGPGAGPGPRKGGGSARTLPIVAGVGMAVGVFGGLMIIFGTGNSDAASDDTKPVVATLVSDGGAGATGDDPQAGVALDGGTAGDMAAAAAADAAPASKSVVLAFEVEPADARITVDGEEVEGDSFTLELDPGQKKRVKVEAQSDGYRSWSKTIAVTSDTDEKTVTIELDKIANRKPVKKKRTGGGGRRTNPRGGPGGLIDL